MAALVGIFRSYLSLTPGAVPCIDGSFLVASSLPSSIKQAQQPDWLTDHLSGTTYLSAPARDGLQHGEVGSFSVDWLLDFTAPPGDSVRFRGSFLTERIAVWLAIAASLSISRLHASVFILLIDLLAWTVSSVLLLRRYMARPETGRLKEMRGRMASVQRELSDARDGRSESIEERDEGRRVMTAKKAQLNRERDEIRTEEKDKAASAGRRHEATAKSLLDQLQGLHLKK